VPSPQDEASRQLMHDRGQLQKEVLQHRDRMRKLLVTLGCWDEVDHRAFANRLRGELVEFGVFLPQGIDAFRAHFVEALEDGATELNGIARTALLRGWEHLQALDQQIAWCDAQVVTHVKHDNNAQRVMAVIGIGPLTASAAVATVGDVTCSRTAANLPTGSARCPNRRAAAARPGWAASPNRATRICARCCSRARARP
jgi:transposase